MREGFVYLALAENGLTKIGRTIDLGKRMKAFATLPVAVTLRHQIRTDDMIWLEAFLHARYGEKRIRGEWFKLDTAELDELCAIPEWNRKPGDLAISPRIAIKFTAKQELLDRVEAAAARIQISVGDYLRLAVCERLDCDRQ